jgi:hypothetical protein
MMEDVRPPIPAQPFTPEYVHCGHGGEVRGLQGARVCVTVCKRGVVEVVRRLAA